MVQRMLPYILDAEVSERETAWRRARAGDAIRRMASRGSVPDRVATGGSKGAFGRSRACGEPDAKRRTVARQDGVAGARAAMARQRRAAMRGSGPGAKKGNRSSPWRGPVPGDGTSVGS